MLIAHLPAGYLLTTALVPRGSGRKALWIGLLASVALDLDLLYFYLIDGGRHPHHGYWTHYPFTWLCVLLGALALVPLLRRFTPFRWFLLLILPNILLHLLLDSLVGDVRWLAPFSDRGFSLLEVPAVHDFWLYNFVFHWTFLFEVAIASAAILVLLVRCDQGRTLSVPIRSRLARFDSGTFGLARRLERSTFDRPADSRLSKTESHETRHSEVERSSAPG